MSHQSVATSILDNLEAEGHINNKVRREIERDASLNGPSALIPALIKLNVSMRPVAEAISKAMDRPLFPSVTIPSRGEAPEPTDDQREWVDTDGEQWGLTKAGCLYFTNLLNEQLIQDVFGSLKKQGKTPRALGVVPVVDLRRAKNAERTEEKGHVLVGEGWVKKYFDDLVNEASKLNASDIHFEPLDQSVRIRMRIDGTLKVMRTLEIRPYEDLANFIMDQAGGQPGAWIVPYDGMIVYRLRSNRSIKLRTAMIPATLPSHEKGKPSFVLRLLGNAIEQMDMRALGIPSYEGNDQMLSLRLLAERKDGLILITGPTGSGKTTTLTAVNQDLLLQNPDRKYLTIQDPVEISQHGVIDVQVNEEAGLTFARGLKAFLRSDPDVIILGEIRDHEVANIALEAALTGHVVWASVHTNSAAKTVARLLNMGLEATIVADALKGVMAQRLAKKVCRRCADTARWGDLVGGRHDMFRKREMALRAIQYKRAPLVYTDLACYPGETDQVLVRGPGCEACGFSGYSGRTSITELMMISPEIQDMINERLSGARIFTQAANEGFKEMWEHAFYLIKTCVITFDDALDALSEREINKLSATAPNLHPLRVAKG